MFPELIFFFSKNSFFELLEGFFSNNSSSFARDFILSKKKMLMDGLGILQSRES